MRVLIDTNVVIDVLQKREPFFQYSNAVILACAQEQAEGLFTAKALTDIFYLMHHHFHDNQICLNVIRKLYQLFTIVDTTATACLQATFSPISDYEDAVMDQTAMACGADYIVTRNVTDFSHASVAAISPADFISLLSL